MAIPSQTIQKVRGHVKTSAYRAEAHIPVDGVRLHVINVERCRLAAAQQLVDFAGGEQAEPGGWNDLHVERNSKAVNTLEGTVVVLCYETQNKHPSTNAGAQHPTWDRPRLKAAAAVPSRLFRCQSATK